MLFTRQKRLKLSNYSKIQLKTSVSLSVNFYNYSQNEISYIPLLLLARKLSCTITLIVNIIPSIGMLFTQLMSCIYPKTHLIRSFLLTI